MSITAADLQTLTIAYLGQPFVHVSANGIDAYELDVAYQGQPFVAEQVPGEIELLAQSAGAAVLLGQGTAMLLSIAASAGESSSTAGIFCYATGEGVTSGSAVAAATATATARVEAAAVGAAEALGGAVGFRFGDMEHLAVVCEDATTVAVQQQAEMHLLLTV
jgi:hypothetical protein